jgi:hypothetical protein
MWSNQQKIPRWMCSSWSYICTGCTKCTIAIVLIVVEVHFCGVTLSMCSAARFVVAYCSSCCLFQSCCGLDDPSRWAWGLQKWLLPPPTVAVWASRLLKRFWGPKSINQVTAARYLSTKLISSFKHIVCLKLDHNSSLYWPCYIQNWMWPLSKTFGPS